MSMANESIDDLVARLTPAQAEAVMADNQKLAVYASAGAGKTRVLTLRIARLVDDGVDPHRILAVTFSKKAAQELRRRLWHLGVDHVRAGTFHRTARELIDTWRAEHHQPPLRIISNRRPLLRQAIDEFEGSTPINAAGLETEITWAKSQGITPTEYIDAARVAQRRTALNPSVVAQLWESYEGRKQGGLDFDDLIVEAVRLLHDETFAAAMRWRSQHVFVDEFQDVNSMQFALVKALLSETSSLFCVGDPNQSIYGFNGADHNFFRTLTTTVPGTVILTLDANHRSTPEIVSSASAVLSDHAAERITATQSHGEIPLLRELASDADEARFIARTLQEWRSPQRSWRSFAVLARTNAQLDVVEQVLASEGLPVRRLAPDHAGASDVEVRNDDPSELRANDQPDDAVALSTFHRAKGLEWPSVFVIGACEGLIPHRGAISPEALDEERRLLYVALTRAEQELCVTWALQRHEGPQPGPARRRSRFLDGFARSLDTLRAERRPAPSPSGAQHAASLRASLAKKLKRT
jgi:DNA helicase II / ATP-dependent DNA helicase PcrA